MKKTIRTFLLTALLAVPAFTGFAAEPKRVIVCTVTTGFRHNSIAVAEKTLAKLADESKAFTIVDVLQQPIVQVPRKPNKPRPLAADADAKAKVRFAKDMEKYEAELAKWTPEMDAELKGAQGKFNDAVKAVLQRLSPANLAAQKIDGVIFANTTGDLPLPDPDGFIKWIEAGHAFIGMHSASDTFHKFTPYLEMLGGEFAGHRAQVGVDPVTGDAAHPAAAGLPSPWMISLEEIYRFKNQDRSKIHALWYLRHDPNEPATAGFFPISWCKAAGQGRVFYTSLGHREDLWSDDPEMKDRKNSPETSRQYQAHILAGIKWALGLVEGSAVPNPEVK